MMDAIQDKLRALEDRVARLEAVKAPKTAPTVDLDSERGDPVVRKDPPRWTGESCTGKRYSQCTPEFLESLAGFQLWKAEKTETENDPAKLKYAGYDRLDAARARGWAARIRLRPKPVSGPKAVADDEFDPFADAENF